MTRSTLFSRNHPTLLLIKKRRSTDATGGLLSKNFAIFTTKHELKSLFQLYWKETPTKIPVNIGKFLKNLFSRTSSYACFWRDFRKWLITSFFLKRRFQNHPNWVILQKYQSLSNQNPLHLTPTLHFELRFSMFIINGYDRKANACSPWTSCFVLFWYFPKWEPKR